MTVYWQDGFSSHGHFGHFHLAIFSCVAAVNANKHCQIRDTWCPSWVAWSTEWHWFLTKTAWPWTRRHCAMRCTNTQRRLLLLHGATVSHGVPVYPQTSRYDSNLCCLVVQVYVHVNVFMRSYSKVKWLEIVNLISWHYRNTLSPYNSRNIKYQIIHVICLWVCVVCWYLAVERRSLEIWIRQSPPPTSQFRSR